MIKKFYVLVWFLFAGSVLFSVVNGPLNGLQLVTFGLIAAGLVYALALWVVFTNTGETRTE